MAVFKCKMCGGDLDIAPGVTVAECEYCGTTQTLPKANEDVVRNLFNRANALRLKCEFDKAEQIYEKIVQEDNTESEAHWGIVLCKYGIEYVEDPKTYKRIPTCHRTSYDAVTADPDYLTAMEYADMTQRHLYEAEAKAIDAIQKNILTIVKEEKPFDVFLCYKETDENGKRTVDSTIANDIYHQLTQEGLKVFFAAITLEDKLGEAYEPYIFAALNSARVMLVIGTKPEYFSAVWVKNEWSRFLKLIKTDRSKLLIPCYKDMDAYELPEEFAHLQAQDMSKIGFINDVVRGIKKVTVKDEPKTAVVKETVVTGGNTNIAPLLKRAFMFLEDGEWDRADEFCEQVLNIDPECTEAYLGKLMAELRCKKQEDLQNCAQPFDGRNNYQKAIRFGDNKLKEALAGYIDRINTRNEYTRLDTIYATALQKLTDARSPEEFTAAAKLFRQISGHKDADELAAMCADLAEERRKERIYYHGKDLMEQKSFQDAASEFQKIPGFKDADALAAQCPELEEEWRKESIYTKAKAVITRKYSSEKENAEEYVEAISLFRQIPGYKDADELISSCEQRIQEIQELQAKETEEAKKEKKAVLIAVGIFFLLFVIIYIIWNVIIPASQYDDALDLMKAGKYEEAIEAFQELDGYKDSEDKIEECKYRQAIALMEIGKYKEAIIAFAEINDYKDSADKLKQCEVALREKLSEQTTVRAGSYHTVGLNGDGTAAATGDNADGQCNVSSWKDIVAISAGRNHTVGLKADGTVVATGSNSDGQCNVGNWTNIVAISAGNWYTVGLKADGTVVATGKDNYDQCDVGGWKDIVAISAGGIHTVGLKADGTVVATGYDDNRCYVNGWEDIIAISAGAGCTVGVKADGTVVAVGLNSYGQCNVSLWKDIVAVSAGGSHTVGLKANGTVVATGDNDDGQCNVGNWTDIVAISAGAYHTVGLKADGTVVAVGRYVDSQCNVSDWTDIKVNK